MTFRLLTRIGCLAAAIAAFSPLCPATGKGDVKAVANRVADWQMANFKDVTYTGNKRPALNWANGALYRGMVEWTQKTGYKPTEDFVVNIGKANNWQMAKRLYHADDICVRPGLPAPVRNTRIRTCCGTSRKGRTP